MMAHNEKQVVELHKALTEKDTDAVKAILQNNFGEGLIDKRNNLRFAAIHIATHTGCCETLQLLLENGFDINITGGFFNRTALHMAVCAQHGNLVKMLLENGADPNIADISNRTPLHDAVFLPSTTEYLLRYGAEINRTDVFGHTPIYYSVTHKQVAVTEQYLQGIHKEYINKESMVNMDRFCAAIQSKDAHLIEAILQFQVDINVTDSYGMFALQKAVQTGCVNVVTLLLMYKANVHLAGETGCTALHLACMLGHGNIARLLLNHGADPNQIDSLGFTPVHIATNARHIEVLKILVEFGADLSLGDHIGKTSLHIAAEEGFHDITEYLLFHGVSVVSVDSSNNTALHLACRGAHIDIVSLLLGHGIPIHMVNVDGLSGISIAAIARNRGLLVLLTQSIQSQMRETQMKSEAQLLLELCNDVATAFLIGVYYTSDIFMGDYALWEMIYSVAMYKDNQTLKALLDDAIDINLCDEKGDAAIHRLVRYNDMKIVDRLLHRKININITNAHGQTALDIALLEQNLTAPCIANLINHGITIFLQNQSSTTVISQLIKDRNQEILTYFFRMLAPEAQDRLLRSEGTILSTSNYMGSLEFMLSTCLPLLTRKTEHWRQIEHLLDMDDRQALTTILNENATLETYDIYKRTPFLLAARYRDRDAIMSLLQAGATKQEVDLFGRNAAHHAAEMGNMDNLTFLGSQAVDLNLMDNYGWSPMVRAIRSGHVACVQHLIDMGCTLMNADESGWTILHHASFGGHVNMVQYFLQKGVDFMAKTHRQLNALYIASCQGNQEVVHLLCGIGCDINVVNENGLTALHQAAQKGYTAIVKILLSNGANIHAVDNLRRSVLHYAIQSNQTSTVQILLGGGIDVNHLDENGISSLVHAAKDGQSDILKLLLHYSNSHNVWSDGECIKAYHTAAANCQKQCIDHFLTFYAERNLLSYLINSTDPLGKTALHAISENTNHNEQLLVQLVDTLVKNGTRTKVGDILGETALHKAVGAGRIGLVRSLSSPGTDINSCNMAGKAYLHVAAQHGHLQILGFLLGMGAVKDIQDKQGRTPLHLAVMYGHNLCLKLLLEQGANVNKVDNEGNTALLAAAAHGYPQIWSMLENKSDIHHVNKQGKTTLHLAAQNGHLDMVKVILKNISPKHLTLDENNKSPYNLARINRHRECAHYISKYLEESIALTPGTPFGCTQFQPSLTQDLSELISEEGTGVVVKEGEAKDVYDGIGKFIELICHQSFGPYTNPRDVGSAHEVTRIGQPDECDFLCPDIRINAICMNILKQDIDPSFTMMRFSNAPQWCQPALLTQKDNYQCVSATKFHKLFRDNVAQFTTRLKTFTYKKYGKISCRRNLRQDYLKQAAASELGLQWSGREFVDMPVSVDLAPCVEVDGWPEDAVPIDCLMPGLEFKVSPFLGEEPSYYLVAKPPHEMSDLAKAVGPDNFEFLWRVDFAHVESRVMCSLPEIIKEIYIGCKLLCKYMDPLVHPDTKLPMFKPISGVRYEVGDLVSSYRLKITCLHVVKDTFVCNEGQTLEEVAKQVFETVTLEQMVMKVFERLVSFLEEGRLPSFVQPFTVDLLAGSKDTPSDILAAARYARDFVKNLYNERNVPPVCVYSRT